MAEELGACQGRRCCLKIWFTFTNKIEQFDTRKLLKCWLSQHGLPFYSLEMGAEVQSIIFVSSTFHDLINAV